MPFKFERLEIPEVLLVEPVIFEDERGFFAETYKYSDFERMGIKYDFVQDNHSSSKKRVLRGLHYQLEPKAQGKLVRIIRGAVFDVAVDIRKGSSTYGRWVGEVLSVENRKMLWVPPGFAHGFVTLEDSTEIFYKTTEEYSPGHDRGIIWNEPEIGIAWPVKDPLVSPKDAKLPSLRDAENNFTYRGGI